MDLSFSSLEVPACLHGYTVKNKNPFKCLFLFNTINECMWDEPCIYFVEQMSTLDHSQAFRNLIFFLFLKNIFIFLCTYCHLQSKCISLVYFLDNNVIDLKIACLIKLVLFCFFSQAWFQVSAEEPSCVPGFESDLLIFKVAVKHLRQGTRLGRGMW